jgi:hypothetical protein
MKTFKSTPKRSLAFVSLICAVCLLLSSCLKENNNANYNPPAALLTVIQASPDEPQLDAYLDNDKINVNPLNFGDVIDYLRAYTGVRNANFYNHATMAKVFSDTISLSQNVAYSLFLANKPTQPEIVLLTDSLIRPNTGAATVRFINLSPDAPPVSLAIQGVQVLATNIPYKGHTAFLPVTGNLNYTFVVRQGTTNTVLATLPNIILNAGSVYTIWFGGLVASTNSSDQLSARILTNAVYY